MLTKNDEQADKDGGECPHAQFECLALLYQLAVLAPEAVRTVATVPKSGLLVDASTPVEAWQVEALVLVHAVLAVLRHHAPLTAAALVYRMQLDDLILSHSSRPDSHFSLNLVVLYYPFLLYQKAVKAPTELA